MSGEDFILEEPDIAAAVLCMGKLEDYARELAYRAEEHEHRATALLLRAEASHIHETTKYARAAQTAMREQRQQKGAPRP